MACWTWVDKSGCGNLHAQMRPPLVFCTSHARTPRSFNFFRQRADDEERDFKDRTGVLPSSKSVVWHTCNATA